MLYTILGLVSCFAAGFIDRNPSIYRFLGVIVSYSIGALLITYGLK